MVKRIALAAALIVALVAPAGCAVAGASGRYAGTSTPQATLSTYFGSAMGADYATTYDCYYQRYRELVTRDEFVSHRRDASRLTAYHVDSLQAAADSAVATATLTFAPTSRGAAPRTTTVREDLVREAGGWRIRVW